MEQYASPVRARRRAPPRASHRLLQVLVCAGAVVAAGALTIEARIAPAASANRPHGLNTEKAAANPDPPAVSPSVALAEAHARAAAQKALAQALARASVQQRAAAPGAPAAAPVNAAANGSPANPPAAAARSATAQAPSQAAIAQAAVAPAASPAQPGLSEADLKLLAVKAAQALKIGDIGGARMVLERAASAGDATALFALGETYDPEVLAKMRVRGLKGDLQAALALYRRASAAGVSQAKERLDELTTGATASAQ